jgi:hypothetical protein
MSANIKRTERSQMNDLMWHLKVLEKQEQAKPRRSRRGEIIKIRAEINEIEIKRNMKNQQNKNLVLWKNKQDWQPPGKSD